MTEALGLDSGSVRVVEYDARWPILFDAERQRIGAAFGTLPLGIEHVGSTSIPGMCAKPLLDIAAGRPRDGAIRDYVVALKGLGYDHRGEQGVPGREFFHRGRPRAYHLHLVDDSGSLWRNYLAFRDYLRSHREEAHQFADVKRTLAGRYRQDREGYTEAKAAYVQGILRRATEAGY